MLENNQIPTVAISQRINRNSFWAYIGGVLVFVSFFIFSFSYKYPTYLADEMGYLSKAAAIAGYIIDGTNQWYAGYSLILASLFHIFSDPFVIWKGVLFLNALMWGGSFIILYNVLVYIFPKKTDSQIIGAMFVCAVYPAFITMSGYAFSSSTFTFFFMLVLLTLPKCIDGDLFWCLLNAIFVGFLFWIHPTALGVIAAYIMSFSFYKKDCRRLALQLLVVACMVFIYKFILHTWLNSIMNLENRGIFEYISIEKIILSYLDIKHLRSLIFYLFGRYVYFTIATLGMFNSFIINFYHKAINNYYQRVDINNDKFLITNFIIMSFLFIITISAMMFVSHFAIKSSGNLSGLLHGRYPELIFLPFLGIILLSDNDNFKFSSVFVILLSGYLYWAPFLKIEPNFNRVNLMAYWPAVLFKENYYITTLFSTLIVLLACCFKRKFMKIMLIILYTICIYHQRIVHIQSESFIQPSEFVSYIQETFPRETIVAFDSQSRKRDSQNRYKVYSYYLYNYNYRRMSKEKWNNTADGVVFLTYNPENHRNLNDFIIATEKSGLYMIVKNNSSFDLFRYRPIEDSMVQEAIFAESFSDNLINKVSFDYKAEDLPTVVGNKSKKSLFTTGKRGILVFGPYLSFNAGEYRFTIKGQIYSLDKAAFYVTYKGSKGVHAHFALKTPNLYSNDIIFQDTFTLSEDVSGLEMKISVSEKDNLRFDSYTVEKIEPEDYETN